MENFGGFLKLTFLLTVVFAHVLFVGIYTVPASDLPKAPPTPEWDDVDFREYGVFVVHAYVGLGAIDTAQWMCKHMINFVRETQDAMGVGQGTNALIEKQLQEMREILNKTDLLCEFVLQWTRFWFIHFLKSTTDFVNRLWFFHHKEDKFSQQSDTEEMDRTVVAATTAVFGAQNASVS